MNLLVLILFILSSYTSGLPTYLLVDRKSDQSGEVVNRQDDNVCRSEECISAASRIIDSMDVTADPCNNFYQYSCGGWIKRNPIPDDKSTINQFSLLRNKNAEKLKTILEQDSTEDLGAVKKAKLFYKSCMDEDLVENFGAKPALDLIAEYGGLPLFLDKHDDSSFRFEKYLGKTKNRIMNEYDGISSPLINMDVVIDDRNSSNHIIKLDQPLLWMYRREYHQNERFGFRQIAYSYLSEIWKANDKEKNISTFDAGLLIQGIHELLRLETDLAKILEPSERRQEALVTYNKMTIEEMSHQISGEFNWLEFVGKVMTKVDIKVGPTTQIIIHGKPYLSKLSSVLKDYDNRILKNYIIVYNLLEHRDHLKFKDVEKSSRTSMEGSSSESSRWSFCVKIVQSLLKEPIGALYVDNFYPEKFRHVVTEMIKNVIAAFKKELDDIEWMDDETREAANVKVDAVNKQIGSPDYIVGQQDQRLNLEYRDLKIDENQFFKNVQNAYNFQLNQSLRKLGKPVDRDNWGLIGAADVTAYYDRFLNTMIFPAAILSPPFFDDNLPYAMNYGGIGDAMGHELTHGFDQRGSTYDAIGNLRNWWTNISRSNFEEKTDCLKKQYSSFYYELVEMFVNGNKTIGENIADNGGIRSAYHGYQIWRKENPGLEFQLDGLQEYTSEQLFFIANAQVWCSNDQPEYAKNRLPLTIYAPNIFRIEGPFKNFDKFAEAFNCQIGEDKMYPNKNDTCRVW